MRMRLLRPGLFAEADSGHFQETGGDAGLVLGVGFYAAQNDDAVGLGSELVCVSNGASPGSSKLDGLHVRPDGSTDRFFGHAEPLQQFGLAFRGCAAMAAHGGDNEWLSTRSFDRIRNPAEQFHELAHAATACSNGD